MTPALYDFSDAVAFVSKTAALRSAIFDLDFCTCYRDDLFFLPPSWGITLRRTTVSVLPRINFTTSLISHVDHVDHFAVSPLSYRDDLILWFQLALFFGSAAGSQRGLFPSSHYHRFLVLRLFPRNSGSSRY